MTERQQNFIARLAQERVLPLDSTDEFERGKAVFTRRVVNGDTTGGGAHGTPGRRYADTMTPAQASNMIDWLLTLPMKAYVADGRGGMVAGNHGGAVATQGGTRPAPVEVAEGRYALLDSDGVVKFYTVDRPTDGRWAGYTFLNAQASDERHPIRNAATKARILGEIAADPQLAMLRYATELGRCGCCGRTLTDEVSRGAGIGPDCAAARGIDRTAWTARAEQATVEGILGRGDREDQMAEAL